MSATCDTRVAELPAPAHLSFLAQPSPDLIGQICAPAGGRCSACQRLCRPRHDPCGLTGLAFHSANGQRFVYENF
jgi:hypothetical protein